MSGGLLRGTGLLLVDHTRDGGTVLLDPDTAGELAPSSLPAFVLSTEREATDGHIVMQEWDLSRAETVGIPILWAHQSRGTLLGQWRDLGVRTLPDGRHLVGRSEFDLDLPEGKEREGQVRRGFARAVSIGWRRGAAVRRSELPKDDPRRREPLEDDCGQPAEGLVMGTTAEPNRLMEASLVPVPADDGAFAIERAFARADEALSRGTATGGGLDDLLAAVANHGGARAFLSRLVAREVERRMATINQAPAPRGIRCIRRG